MLTEHPQLIGAAPHHDPITGTGFDLAAPMGSPLIVGIRTTIAPEPCVPPKTGGEEIAAAFEADTT